MNLFAYNIGTQSINTLPKYRISDLEGNSPYMVSTQSSLGSYSNISSILNWDDYGDQVGYNHYQILQEIEIEYNSLTQSGTNWDDLTLSEKKVLSKYFIVDKNKRDEVHTQIEQDENDHYVLYHHLNEDALERVGYDYKITPKSIDYKKDVNMRLHPEYYIDDAGFLTKCIYYEDLVVTKDTFSFSVFNFSNPVLKYEADYIVGDDYYVKERTVTRSWYLTSGTYSEDSKISRKVYEPLVARDEGRRRRKNLVNKLLVETVGLFIMTSEDLDTVQQAEEDAMPLMKEVTGPISEYYEYGSRRDSQDNPCPLYQAISSSTYSRLDNYVPDTGDTVTIRMFILDRIEPDLSGYQL